MSKYHITAKPMARAVTYGWIDGTVDGFYFQAKVYDTGSVFGINNGRVSKLIIRDKQNNQIIAYERGWDREPANDKQRELLQALLDFLENCPRRKQWEKL